MNIVLKDVKLFDDNLTDLEMLKSVIDESGGDDPLHIIDLGNVLKKHQDWLQKMPRVIPYFAIKSNPDVNAVKLIASLGGHFDCASKEEMMHVIGLGVPSERIIFANPVKCPSHLEYAKKLGVALMTVDHECELKKIKEIYPEAKILIRIRHDTKFTTKALTTKILGLKFGCDPKIEAVNLIKSTIELGLDLQGFCFHAGSPCGEAATFCQGIFLCNNLINIARSLGCKSANIIDIGGGFSGLRDFNLDEFAGPINVALDTLDPDIKVIAEPGRYYVSSACTAAARVIGKKMIMRDGEKTFSYFLSDGVYMTFFQELLNISARHPVLIDADDTRGKDNEKFLSTMWGPTCDPLDRLLKDEMLPEYQVGDWLAWYDVGAYGIALSNSFNGFEKPKVYSVIRRSDWESLCNGYMSNQEIFRRNSK